MFYKQVFKLMAAFGIVAFLPCCNSHTTNNGIEAYIKSTPLSKADFTTFCLAQHLDSARTVLGIKRGIYKPEDQNCGSDIAVQGHLDFNYGQIEKSLENDESIKALVAYTTTLYKLIAEPVKLGGSHKKQKSINYFDRTLSCKNIFDSLSTGAWAFDCGGHAEMAKVFLDSFGRGKYTTKTIQLSRKSGYEVNHIITLVYYQQNGQSYGIALDCQNGMLGPVKKNKAGIPSISEQKSLLDLMQTDTLGLIFIPEADLHKKRNLMDNAFYCNVLPDTQNVYHLAYAESGYKYERLTYSMLYYSWFKAGIIDAEKYEQNLVALLVNNAPQN